MIGDQSVVGPWGLIFCLSLFAGMLLLYEVGRRVGTRRRLRDPEGARLGLGPVESATFGLLGLLIAFTFSGAATRFDTRRHLVVEEANMIGTAWLRIDVLAEADQLVVRQLFREYLDSRLATYAKLPDLNAARAELARSETLQRTIWEEAIVASANVSPARGNLLLSSLNEMIDITTTRTMVTQMHPPGIIYGMLFTAALMSALLAGYNSAGGKTRAWLHAVGLALVVSGAMYVIIEIEHPRQGFVRVDAVDVVLRELRRTMGD